MHRTPLNPPPRHRADSRHRRAAPTRLRPTLALSEHPWHGTVKMEAVEPPNLPGSTASCLHIHVMAASAVHLRRVRQPQHARPVIPHRPRQRVTTIRDALSAERTTWPDAGAARSHGHATTIKADDFGRDCTCD